SPEAATPEIEPPAAEPPNLDLLPEPLPEAAEPEPAPALIPPTVDVEPPSEAPPEELPEPEPVPQVEEAPPEVKALEDPVGSADPAKEPDLKDLVPEENPPVEPAPEDLSPAPAVEAPVPPPDETVPVLPAPADLPLELEPPLFDSEPVPGAPAGLPEAERPLSLPPQSPDVLDSAPTSSRFFKEFKQWRQQYQTPAVPPEMAPSSGLRELPDALNIPDPEGETNPPLPGNTLEFPPETLPEIVVPPNREEVRQPLDLVEPEPQVEQPDQPDKTRPAPASPEQLLI
ncbi:MAG: hypothetical protein ICV62_12205, partial [Cyanobacteria bacterium Co-bin13]|nr:hypothetical protein [Cyanobacteria bacterium Co-bin13]